MIGVLRVLSLALALVNLPEMTPGRALVVAAASRAAATAYAPAELLASLAWAESRGDRTVVTGRTCGVLQVNPLDVGLPWRETCAAWAESSLAGMRGGVLELETMLRDPRVHGDLRRALLYRACGNAAFDPASDCAARKGPWVQSALDRARYIRHAAGGAS